MLDPWIIEQIRQREEEERRRREQRPALEIPYRAPNDRENYRDTEDEPSSTDRGVVIIDL